MKIINVILIIVGSCGNLVSQETTVGLILNDPLSEEGYSLFSPDRGTYLIDNCGYLVNIWQSEFRPGLAVYLDHEGNLVRAGSKNGSLSAPGAGGVIEKYNWDNELIWQYTYNSDNVRQHHDIELMPNGNILLLAWEVKTESEALQSGRDSTTLANNIYPEHIVEVKPLGFDQAEIVWKWHAWDHLVQDYDSTKDNFGVISDHPELIDVNFETGFGGLGGNQDWMHANALAYNSQRDEIAVSLRNFSEILIIDHSTTTEEAAGHSGGSSNKGGDILYRFGNPISYQRGEKEDQMFFNQHDIRWIPSNHKDAGKLMVFNNGNTRPEGQYSSVDIFQAPLDEAGRYIIDDIKPFGPEELDYSYDGDALYSSIMSGAQALPNGNILICEGASGRFIEINRDEEEVVWRYQNPIGLFGPVNQGSDNSFIPVFRISRYFSDFIGFQGKNLEGTQPLELDPIDYVCQTSDGPVAISEVNDEHYLKVKTNPFGEQLKIEVYKNDISHCKLIDITGKQVYESYLVTGENLLTFDLKSGIYILISYDKEGRAVQKEKLIHI